MEVLGILTPKVGITDLPLSTTENTEVSVFFTDGWQHLISMYYYTSVLKRTTNTESI